MEKPMGAQDETDERTAKPEQQAELSSQRLKEFRAQTFRLNRSIANSQEALTWVNERGFVFFWPIRGITLPSLWVAVAGDRPVADAHDDPGHVTWGWKDEALGKRIWYYAKVLRRKATLIALEVAPFFYALSENYGTPEEDHLIAYREGRLTLAAKNVYEALLDGPLDTITLRRKAHLTTASDSEFNRALETLQADFKILPVGVAQAGAWNYAFRYAITAYHYPDLPQTARAIGESQARETLLMLYFRSVGAAQVRDVEKLFGWGREVTRRALNRLLHDGRLTAARLANQPGEWLVLRELL
ncbi:MAG: winged helix DNA-binding domain-containing protein [Anaerolineales bacterium]|nr:winged helix DNA-binding domain-containing protein [Anaerolineales bacterium]MCX7755772.1 winged helix DNA-binding domain-containing protein [Anaerolineales bacterium]MDW8279030.1 crosslink repair DNA glycosylase YcaQ family protein [Anaerolineales bacterium]